MDNKPRILIFSLAYDPFWGGAEFAVKEITDRLGGQYNFDMITYRFGKDWKKQEKSGTVMLYRTGVPLRIEGGAHYGNKWKKILWSFMAVWQAFVLHRENRYDAVWCLMANFAAGSSFLFKIFYPRVPLFLTLQEGDEERYIKRRIGVFLPLWKLFFRMVDRVQVISTYLADWARRNGAKCKIDVVPNGVSLGQYQISNIKYQNELRDKLNIQRSEKVIVTTSRLVLKNGVDILIKAVGELKFLIPDSKFKILIVGDGPDRAKLEQLARSQQLAASVLFVGSVPYEDIPKYLAISDVFVRPSRSEGLGSSFLEAMAAGLPIIGTPVGGIPDFLKDKETGLFARVDDAKDLAQKIKLLIEDDALRNRLIKNGRNLVEEKYNWDIIAQKMSKFLNVLE